MIDQDVREIHEAERRTIERMLGRELQEGERVYLMAYRPGRAPDPVARQAAFDRMEAIVAKAQSNAAARGITSQEADEALEEAIEQIRRPKAP